MTRGCIAHIPINDTPKSEGAKAAPTFFAVKNTTLLKGMPSGLLPGSSEP
jgi:hypothetical protein